MTGDNWSYAYDQAKTGIIGIALCVFLLLQVHILAEVHPGAIDGSRELLMLTAYLLAVYALLPTIRFVLSGAKTFVGNRYFGGEPT